MSDVLLALVLLATGASPQEVEQGILEAAYVRVIIEGSYATVIAQYDVDRSGAPFVFEAPRLPGQILVIDRAFGPQTALEVKQLVDVGRITVPASAPGLSRFRIGYRVEDDFSRIPIFVPSLRSAPGSIPVELEIFGLPAEADPGNAVPPVQRGADEALSAATAGLPAVIQLPPSGQGLSTTRVLDWAALLAVCLAGLFRVGQRMWAGRNRAADAV